MGKIRIQSSVTTAETFNDFLLTCKAKGLSEKTLTSYKQHFASIRKHIPAEKPIEELGAANLEEMIADMRDAGFASNSIRRYTRTLKVFLSWCKAEGLTDLNIPLYKAEDTVKETYTDIELGRLL